MPKLTGPDGSQTAADYGIKSEPLTIGRSPECLLTVADNGVSRLHAVVERSAGKVVIRDQSSRGGTYVNGDAVEEAILKEGDTVKVGDATFTYHVADAPKKSALLGDGEDGESGESRRAKREVLGGVRMSKRTQTIVKIACAGISFICIVAAVMLLGGRRNQPVYVKKVIHENPMEKPDLLAAEARTLTQQAQKVNDGGDTAKAYEIMCEAKAKMEEATQMVEALAHTHQEKGYEWVERKATELNTQAQGVRMEWFRLQMQKMREESQNP